MAAELAKRAYDRTNDQSDVEPEAVRGRYVCCGLNSAVTGPAHARRVNVRDERRARDWRSRFEGC
jgi:hypothetical protein